MAKSNANKSTPVSKLDFEHAMSELEQLVEQIESGEIGLEQALKRYERGIALIKRCRTVLDTAEQRIAELTSSAGGELEITGDAEVEAESDEEEMHE
ncbi:MAG: exodeoxyribonuclease VII small subunit [Phycisphaeraceae bacterium]